MTHQELSAMLDVKFKRRPTHNYNDLEIFITWDIGSLRRVSIIVHPDEVNYEVSFWDDTYDRLDDSYKSQTALSGQTTLSNIIDLLDYKTQLFFIFNMDIFA